MDKRAHILDWAYLLIDPCEAVQAFFRLLVNVGIKRRYSYDLDGVLREYSNTRRILSELVDELGVLIPDGDGFILNRDSAASRIDAPVLAPRVPKRKRRRSARRGISPKLRYSILSRDGFCCQYCGVAASNGAELHVDHKVSVKNGGSNHPDNLVAACMDCNLGKGARNG